MISKFGTIGFVLESTIICDHICECGARIEDDDALTAEECHGCERIRLESEAFEELTVALGIGKLTDEDWAFDLRAELDDAISDSNDPMAFVRDAGAVQNLIDKVTKAIEG